MSTSEESPSSFLQKWRFDDAPRKSTLKLFGALSFVRIRAAITHDSRQQHFCGIQKNNRVARRLNNIVGSGTGTGSKEREGARAELALWSEPHNYSVSLSAVLYSLYM